jgi:hypothetical protein
VVTGRLRSEWSRRAPQRNRDAPLSCFLLFFVLARVLFKRGCITLPPHIRRASALTSCSATMASLANATYALRSSRLSSLGQHRRGVAARKTSGVMRASSKPSDDAAESTSTRRQILSTGLAAAVVVRGGAVDVDGYPG